MVQPKWWNSIFAVKVKIDYDNKKLTESNIDEWETEQNNGIKPIPDLGTRGILKYYIATEYNDYLAKLKTLWSQLSGSEQYAADDAISSIENDKVDIVDSSVIENYVRASCKKVDNGNAEAEYEDEDFYEDEVDNRMVLNYVLYKYHLL